MNLDEAIERHIRFLSAERNMAPRTAEAYRYDLRRFAAFLADKTGGTSWLCSAVDAWSIKDYLAMLQEEHSLKPASLARVISSIRSLFRWALKEGILTEDPAAGIRTPKKAKKLPVYLTPDEASALVRHREEEHPLSTRNRTMLLLLTMTGIRLSELVGIDVGDVDFEQRTVRVLGKGRKERLVPLNSRVQDTLRQWLAERPPASSPALFLDRHGNRVTPRMVQYAVTKAVKALGLDPRVSPHKLRHTFATGLYGQDVALRDIQELLGHANIVSTSVYTHTNVEKVRAAVEKLG